MTLPLFALTGAVTALAYAASLAWNTRLYVSIDAVGWGAVLHIARVSATIAALVGLAHAGAAPFCAALIGFACAHAAAVFTMRRQA